MQSERQPAFKRNDDLEALLREINSILEIAEDGIMPFFTMPRYPVIYIVGCARAGSTLILQWLANTGIFAYPTNLLSRFYAAPYIGARIQQMLTEPRYNFRDEFADLTSNIGFFSELGKTKGALAPNEFWYFWRRFFDYGEIQRLDEEALRKVNIEQFISELSALEAAFDKPLVMKGHIINWNIPFISRNFEKVLFVHIIREPIFNAQSLLESRKKYYGAIDRWYSFKPPEYERLKDRHPYDQVAGQVYFTNRAISNGLAQVSSERWIRVRYEEFCKDPANLFFAIRDKFVAQGLTVDWRYDGPQAFECSNRIHISDEALKILTDAYATFAKEPDRE